MNTLDRLQAHIADMDAHEAREDLRRKDHPSLAAARANIRHQLNDSIIALRAGAPDPHAAIRAAGYAAMQRGPDRPPPLHAAR